MNIKDFSVKERFKRNTIIEEIGETGQQKLFNSKVLIAGAGGLGCGLITNLVSAGVGSLGIIDYDCVELSNLNRQFIYTEKSIGQPKTEEAYKWIKNYNPLTNVDIYKLRIEESSETGFFEGYNLVIDCFDSYKSKFILNEICVKKKLPLIHGGVEEFFGQVITVIPQKTACLGCFLDYSEFDLTNGKGIISSTAGVISSIQSMEAVKFLTGLNNLLTNTLLSYDGIKQEFRKVSLDRRRNCPVCYN